VITPSFFTFGHGLGDQRADGLVIVRADTGHLLDLRVVVAHALAHLLELGYNGDHGLVDTALQVHGVGTCGHVLQTSGHDGLCEYRGGGGSITGLVSGLAGHFLQHLGAHVLHGVLQLDLLGYGHAVLGHLGCSEFLVDDHVAALGTEGHLHRVREVIDTTLQAVAGVDVELDVLGCHCVWGMCRGAILVLS
jgi:hypothetical protein